MKRFLKKSFARNLTLQDYWHLGKNEVKISYNKLEIDCNLIKTTKEHDETSKYICNRLENKWTELSNKYASNFMYIFYIFNNSKLNINF